MSLDAAFSSFPILSNVLVKLGFTHEGTLRQRVLFRDSCEDLIYFGLLKSEWTKAAAPRE